MRDDQFEEFLKSFQPQRPAPLPVAGDSPIKRRLAASAVLLAAASLLLAFWKMPPSDPPVSNSPQASGLGVAQPFEPPASVVGRLSRTARTNRAFEDSAGLEAQLEQDFHSAAPHFDRDDSALRILSRE